MWNIQDAKKRYRCTHMSDDEFAAYLGRSIRFSGWMYNYSKLALCLILGLTLADLFLDHLAPLWFRLTIYANCFIPILVYPFREYIYRNWKWIPEED